MLWKKHAWGADSLWDGEAEDNSAISWTGNLGD